MKNENSAAEMTPRESIELITGVINNCRRDLEKNGGVPLVIWGFLTLAVSIAVWAGLAATGNPAWNLLWFAELLGYPLMTLWYRRHSVPAAITWLGRMLAFVWTLFGVCAIGLTAISFFVDMPTVSLIVLALGFATAVTGLLTRYRFVTVTGIAAVLAGVPLTFVLSGSDLILLFAGIVVIELIVPGLVLNSRSRK